MVILNWAFTRNQQTHLAEFAMFAAASTQSLQCFIDTGISQGDDQGPGDCSNCTTAQLSTLIRQMVVQMGFQGIPEKMQSCITPSIVVVFLPNFALHCRANLAVPTQYRISGIADRHQALLPLPPAWISKQGYPTGLYWMSVIITIYLPWGLPHWRIIIFTWQTMDTVDILLPAPSMLNSLTNLSQNWNWQPAFAQNKCLNTKQEQSWPLVLHITRKQNIYIMKIPSKAFHVLLPSIRSTIIMSLNYFMGKPLIALRFYKTREILFPAVYKILDPNKSKHSNSIISGLFQRSLP